MEDTTADQPKSLMLATARKSALQGQIMAAFIFSETERRPGLPVDHPQSMPMYRRKEGPYSYTIAAHEISKASLSFPLDS